MARIHFRLQIADENQQIKIEVSRRDLFVGSCDDVESYFWHVSKAKKSVQF